MSFMYYLHWLYYYISHSFYNALQQLCELITPTEYKKQSDEGTDGRKNYFFFLI